jgi:hypothetical protein
MRCRGNRQPTGLCPGSPPLHVQAVLACPPDSLDVPSIVDTLLSASGPMSRSSSLTGVRRSSSGGGEDAAAAEGQKQPGQQQEQQQTHLMGLPADERARLQQIALEGFAALSGALGPAALQAALRQRGASEVQVALVLQRVMGGVPPQLLPDGTLLHALSAAAGPSAVHSSALTRASSNVWTADGQSKPCVSYVVSLATDARPPSSNASVASPRSLAQSEATGEHFGSRCGEQAQPQRGSGDPLGSPASAAAHALSAAAAAAVGGVKGGLFNSPGSSVGGWTGPPGEASAAGHWVRELHLTVCLLVTPSICMLLLSFWFGRTASEQLPSQELTAVLAACPLLSQAPRATPVARPAGPTPLRRSTGWRICRVCSLTRRSVATRLH